MTPEQCARFGLYEQSILQPATHRRVVPSRDVGGYVSLFMKPHPATSIPIDNFLPPMKPFHFNDALSRLENTSTSPGIYWRSKGYHTKGEVVADPKAINSIRHLIHRIKRKLPATFPPCQIVPTTGYYDTVKKVTKVRYAWVFPIEVVLAESMFVRPIIDYLNTLDYVPSPETHCRLFCPGGIALDLNKSDTSLPHQLVKDVLTSIFDKFDLTCYAGFGKVRGRSDLSYLVETLKRYIVHTPFVSKGSSGISYAHHGVPSGSMFTNIITTIATRSLVKFALDFLRIQADIVTYGDNMYVSREAAPYISHIIGIVESVAGVSIRVDENNIMGHLVYCKAHCCAEQTYRPGLWFRNVLARCKPIYTGAVAYALSTRVFKPTPMQRRQLLHIAWSVGVRSLPPRLKAWLTTLR